MIQTHLLDLLSLGLTRKPYRENLPTATAHSLAQAIQLGQPPCMCVTPGLSEWLYCIRDSSSS